MTSVFIGLGIMGAPMARHYARKFDTLLLDPSPKTAELAAELGVEAISSASALPAEVDTALLMLPNSTVVESVVAGDGGLLSHLKPGSLIIDMSSSIPSSTRELANQAEARGISFVDAPVSGGRRKAESGELAFLLGGDSEAVARATPHIQPMAGAIVHVGPSGAGHAAKALNNLLSASNIAAAAEVLSAATRYGIVPNTMVDVINAATGRSQASEVKFPQEVLTGRWGSGFTYDLMLKDLRIARNLIEELGVFTPVTETVFSLAEGHRELLGEHPDHTELARIYEEKNELKLQASD